MRVQLWGFSLMKSVRYSESCTCLKRSGSYSGPVLDSSAISVAKLLLLLAQTLGRAAVGDLLVHRVLLLLLGFEALLDLEFAFQQPVQVLGQAAAQAGLVALAGQQLLGLRAEILVEVFRERVLLRARTQLGREGGQVDEVLVRKPRGVGAPALFHPVAQPP